MSMALANEVQKLKQRLEDLEYVTQNILKTLMAEVPAGKNADEKKRPYRRRSKEDLHKVRD